MYSSEIKTIVKIQVVFGFFSKRTLYWIGDTSFTKTPFYLRVFDEEEMLNRIEVEIVNAPKHLQGEWVPMFDEKREVIVKYIPTPEEVAERKRIQEAHDRTWEIALMCASLGD